MVAGTRTVGAAVIHIAGCLLLTACAALNVYHDPETGFITRSQVPKILQSVRCELVTFFDDQQVRSLRYNAIVNPTKKGAPPVSQAAYVRAVEDYAYFPLDPNQLSSTFLDLKVIDSVSIPSGSPATTINQTILSNGGGDKRTWHLGPNVADTNTYELNWPFVIQQNSTLDLTHHEASSDSVGANPFFPCYRNLPPGFGGDPAHHRLADVEALARHKFPESENFARIYVDGTQPLAAWMIDRGAQLGTALFPDIHKNWNLGPNDERMYPAQMIYTFTVQFGFGGDASLSLITATWNPVGIDLAGSTQQTSMLTLYINGYDAANANGGKSGIAATAPQTSEHVRDLQLPLQVPPPNCSNPSECSRGFLKYPLPINPP